MPWHPQRRSLSSWLVPSSFLPAPLRDDPVVRWFSASNEMVARVGLTHSRPSFGINDVRVGRAVPVREEAVETSPFGTLLHFAKQTDVVQPRVLVVAALAGHFSTLLASTVRALSEHHDVYVTDWHNARDVPLADGAFGFDAYVDHIKSFLTRMGPVPTSWQCANPAPPCSPRSP